MICESKLNNGYYWVFFNNKWNLLEYYDDDFWWPKGNDCDEANGCIALPVTEPRSDDDYLKSLGLTIN